MIEEIEKFYEKTKLRRLSSFRGDELIEYKHVFHKEYPRFPSFELPSTRVKGEFERLLLRRESRRSFADKPVSTRTLGRILSTCVIRTNKPEERTYPSAGSRFPVELYLVAFKIRGIEPGAYHYDIRRFSLDLLLRGNLRKYESKIVSQFVRRPAGAIILTGVLSRSAVKYGAKSYPFTFLEAGHIAQNILLSCCKYGLGCCPVGGFIDDAVSDILDLTSEEIPLYVVGFGYPKRQS